MTRTTKRPIDDIAIELKQFEQHALFCICDTERVKSFYMRRHETGIMRCLITFTPEGIVIQGDITPERNGSVSCIGYGLDWFAGPLGETYLCQKFLTKRFCPELAIEELRDPEGQWRHEDYGVGPDQHADLDDICDLLSYGEMDFGRMADAMESAGLELDAETPGWGYDPTESRWLRAIQQTFARLYAEHSR